MSLDPPCERCRFFMPHPDVMDAPLATQYGLCNHPMALKSVLTRDRPELWKLFEQTQEWALQHDRMIASQFRRVNHLCCGPQGQYFKLVDTRGAAE